MNTDELTPAQLKALETAEKLFRLAGKNPNQHEAALASAKGMKILEDLGLDMSVLEQGGTDKIKRADEKLTGGLYRWQRDLWEQIAKLHFCFYWNQYNYDPDKVNKYQTRKSGTKTMGGFRFEHRIVGRLVNVIATKNMAEYLEGTVERLTRENVHNDPSLFYTNYSASFRSGVAEEIIGKLYERRQDMLNEERRKEQEAIKRAAVDASGASTGRSLTLGSLAKQEEEANFDFLHGDGAYQARKVEKLRRAEERKQAEEDYTKWAASHPEEARKLEEEARKSRRSSWNAGTRTEKDNRDPSAYKAGRAAGKGISIEQQAGHNKSAGAIG